MQRLAVRRETVTLVKLLGSGNFGAVHEGTMPPMPAAAGSVPAAAAVTVAVKIPDVRAYEEFAGELKIMSALRQLGGHPHIVGAVGCVLGADGLPPLLLLDLCARRKRLILGFMGVTSISSAHLHVRPMWALSTCR